MRRLVPGMLLLGLLVAGSFGMQAIGQPNDKAEQIKLETLKTDLLQKIVKAHLDGAYVKDKAKEAHVKALTEVLGGAAGVPGKFSYEYKAMKPVVTYDARPRMEPAAGDSARATAALRDLVGASFAKVAADGFTDAAKKYTVAAADAKALGDSVRVLWAAAPPADPLKPIVARLDQLAKDLAAVKALEKRVAGAEKSVKELEALGKRVDDLAKQVKDLPTAVKALEKLKDVPDRLQKVEEGVKNLGPALKKLEDALKKLEPLSGQVKKHDEQLKGLGERLDKLEKGTKDLNPRLQKVEKAITDLEPRLKKLEADLKSAADELKKASGGTPAILERMKALEEQLKKEREERARDIKRLDDLLKPRPLPVLPYCPDGVPHYSEPPLVLPDCDCSATFPPPGGHACSEILPAGPYPNGPEAFGPGPDHGPGHGPADYSILAPAIGTGAFHEHFPVLKLVPGPAHHHGHGHPGPAMPWVGHGNGGPPAAFPWHELPVATRPPAKAAPAAQPEKSDEVVPSRANRLVSRGTVSPAHGREVTTTGKLERVGHKSISLRGLTENDAERLFWQGYRLYWQGEHGEALALFEAAAELSDQDARFWYFRSMAESVLGQTREADDSLSKAVDLHLRGRPSADLIGKALERVQGEPRQHLRKALDARRTGR